MSSVEVVADVGVSGGDGGDESINGNYYDSLNGTVAESDDNDDQQLILSLKNKNKTEYNNNNKEEEISTKQTDSHKLEEEEEEEEGKEEEENDSINNKNISLNSSAPIGLELHVTRNGLDENDENDINSLLITHTPKLDDEDDDDDELINDLNENDTSNIELKMTSYDDNSRQTEALDEFNSNYLLKNKMTNNNGEQQHSESTTTTTTLDNNTTTTNFHPDMKYIFKNTRYYLIKSSNMQNVDISKEKV
jgi:hypothetical protein